MKRLVVLFSFCLSMLATVAWSQEICNNNLDDDGDGLIDCRDGDCPGKVCEMCNNGIDDDKDGFIDCYDKECTLDNACDGFFLGKDAVCEVKPTNFPPFQMKIKYRSPTAITNHINRLIAGDVDNDGIPELITTYRNGDDPTISSLNILQANGTSLVAEKQYNLLNDNLLVTYEDIAMADIDGDRKAEIFIMSKKGNSSDYKIAAYRADGSAVWTSPISFPSYPGTMGIADFDGDGKSELYVRTSIYDAHSGAFMGSNDIDNDNTGENAGVNGWGMNSNGPVAVDIESTTSGLELVAGCRIYSVSINRGTMTATINLLKKRSEYTTRTGRGNGSATSIADFNQDGFLDIVAVGSLAKYNTTTTIFFWDVQNNTLKTYTDVSGSGDYKDGWKNGAGRVNLADIDGDGKLNAVYVSGKYLYALEEKSTSLDTLWRRQVTEETSGITGCTLFDFNADNKSEIVYRDEDYIYIYTTTNIAGVVTVTRSTPVRCSSRTSNEYPIVADIDGDGSTEICVACSTSNSTNGANLDIWDEAEVRVYQSANEPWVPARRVWNQHGYFVVNVNDDLSIPRNQQLHHLIYATDAPCRANGPSRPLNSFLNQSPYLNSKGCPSYASPDIAVSKNSLIVNPPTCPSLTFTVSFRFKNIGDIGLTGDLPVSFYNGDPTKVGATKLKTTTVKLTSFNPGDSTTVSNISITGPGNNFTLYIALNDAGTTTPTPIKLPNSKFVECNYDNNILSAPVVPNPVAITALKVKDNLVCATGTTTPNNGAVEAYILNGSVKNTTDYTFYWTLSGTAKPIPADKTGPTLNQLAAGSYTVYAIHKTAQCSSDTATVSVADEISNFSARIDIISGLTNCKDNPNGHLDAVVLDKNGTPVTGASSKYDYAWFVGPDYDTSPSIAVTHNASGLLATTYTVKVTEKATSCFAVQSNAVPDNTVKPVVSASKTDIVCSNGNSGGVSANVGGVTTGFTFEWYKGSAVKPTADFTGASATGLTQGSYTVVATNQTTKCSSDPVTVTVGQTTPPVITSAVSTQDQISCDVSALTGSATVTPSGSAAAYDYQWYTGQTTAVASAISGATTVNLTGQKAGIYTVKVTDKITKCLTTAEVTIKDGVVPITLVSITPVANTSCVPTNGSIEVSSLSLDTPADYTFVWTNVSTGAVLADTDNKIENLPSGTYSVRATHKVRKCQSNFDTRTINNVIPAISITQVDFLPPNDCTSPDGFIEVSATSTGNTTGYDFDWFRGSGSGTPIGNVPSDIVTVNSYKKTALRQGSYTVVVTDKQNGCQESASFALEFSFSHRIKLISKTDITTCTPGIGGQIQVELTPSPTEPSEVYNIILFPTSTYPTNPSAGGITLTNTSGNFYETNVALNPDQDYTIVALATVTYLQQCEVSLTTSVQKSTSNPMINASATNASLVNNSFCNVPTTNIGNGAINLMMTGNAADYSYAWSNGMTTQNISGLTPGDYTVTVTTTTLLNQGCVSTATFNIGSHEDLLTVDRANGDLQTSAVTHCNPADGVTPMTEGSAFFQALQVNGTPQAAPFANFDFKWFRESNNAAVADNDADAYNRLSMLDTGRYYVVATNINSTCSVTASFSIQDQSIGTVDVTLKGFKNQIRCVAPQLGLLAIEASGNSSTGYSYEWYIGTLGGTPVSTNDTLNNLSAGSFTIKAINNSTDCWAVDTYTIPQEVNTIQVGGSSTPLTSCDNINLVPATLENASAVGAVIFAGFNPDGTPRTSIDQNSFSYIWKADGVQFATTRQIVNLKKTDFDGKVITVEAIDLVDVGPNAATLCHSTPVVVNFTDERIYPAVTAQAIVPNAICDLTTISANGVANASVGGNIIDYVFDWFEGAPVAPQTNSGFYIGPQADGLSSSPTFTPPYYTVMATDFVTGCTGTDTTRIPFVPVPVPAPTITVISQVTSCIEGNGILDVSVGGNTIDYTFRWYDGGVIKTTPDFIGDHYDSLAVNTYGVTATSIATGCISPLVTEDIKFTPTYPEFTLAVETASCEEENGGIYLTITNDVELGTVVWATPEGTILGDPVLTGIPAGQYKVTVTSDLGCETTKDVEVNTDIRVYNGISRNGDGKNDFFFINCIENFPGNHVKIFNRAGTLVYEVEGYDNIDIFFDGRSNKGISVMGTNLPDGTYYYVVDKRDGSRPKAGYLEIVN